MQINPDISPIISPKSNFSGSYTSPHENDIPNFHANKYNFHFSRHENRISKTDLHSEKNEAESSTRNNDSATNESFSVDRYGTGGE